MQVLNVLNGYANLVHVEGGCEWRDLLTQLGGTAIELGLAKEGIEAALIERESSYPTGIAAEIGIAMPHADSAFTAKDSVLVATLDKPVLFNPMGGGDETVPVEVVFLLLLDDIDKHLTLLKAVSKLIPDTDKIRTLFGDGAEATLAEVFDFAGN